MNREFGKGFDSNLYEKKGEQVLFCDFLGKRQVDEVTGNEIDTPRVYQAGGTIDVLTPVIAFLADHNEAHPAKAMNLILFEDALEHVLRINRIIGMSKGNALLVGVGGSGKQSLTRLAAFISKQRYYELAITKQYGVSHLLDDLRELYKVVGKEAIPTTFIVPETHIKEEMFLEYINSILTTGDIPGLFPKDELNLIAMDLRKAALEEFPGFDDTPENLKRYFFNRVRKHLSVVVCMSPMNKHFAARCRRFPGLLSGTTVNWFLPWPAEALMAVSEGVMGEDFTPSLKKHMGAVHSMTSELCKTYHRDVYLTPKSFLSFLDMYKKMYTKKKDDIEDRESRVVLGLQKLETGAEDVAKMKVSLAQEEIKLREAEKACNSMLSSLEISSLNARKETEIVEAKKAHCEKEAVLIKKEKEACQEDLAKAQPYLDEADRAANSIKPSDLNELKKLPKPGDIIKLTFDGVMILRKYPLEPVEIERSYSWHWQSKTLVRFCPRLVFALQEDDAFRQWIFESPLSLFSSR